MNIRTINRIITIFLALALGFSAATISYTQILAVPDEYITNLIYKYNFIEQADDRITIVAIDEQTQKLYGNYENWSRSLLADAVTELSSQNASVIGLDIDLSQESNDFSGDDALALACADAGNVVALAMLTYGEAQKESNPQVSAPVQLGSTPENTTSTNQQAQRFQDIVPKDFNNQNICSITYPYSSLASAVSIGINNAMQQSVDGVIHNTALTVNYCEAEYDCFATAIYKAYQGSQNEACQLPELDNENMFGFNSIWNTKTYQVISFADLLSGDYDADLITDKIVLIGEYDPVPADQIFEYLNVQREQAEVLVHAAIIQSLLNQRTVENISPLFQAIYYGLIFSLFYLLFSSRKRWIALPVQALLLMLIVATAHILNTFGYRLPLLVPMIFAAVTIIMLLTHQSIINAWEKHKMEKTLKLYVDSHVVDEISAVDPYALSQISERKHIAVLFIDIRGFTTLSESLEPEQVVEILNEYLSLVASAIQNWNGTLDKFIGDAAMALFNAPGDLDDYVLRAVCAADEIVKSADYIRDKFEKRFGQTVSFGIGINCGDAIIGNIGSKNRMDYTAIGDTVNTASRLESKAAPGQILVSESVLNEIRNHVDASFVGELSLKGKTHTVKTYQIDRITPPEHLLSNRKEFFNEIPILHSLLGSN